MKAALKKQLCSTYVNCLFAIFNTVREIPTTLTPLMDVIKSRIVLMRIVWNWLSSWKHWVRDLYVFMWPYLCGPCVNIWTRQMMVILRYEFFELDILLFELKCWWNICQLCKKTFMLRISHFLFFVRWVLDWHLDHFCFMWQ